MRVSSLFINLVSINSSDVHVYLLCLRGLAQCPGRGQEIYISPYPSRMILMFVFFSSVAENDGQDLLEMLVRQR